MSKTVTVRGQQRWQYSYIERRTEEALVRALNEQGDAGWDAITILKHEAPKGTFWTAFLKRPHASPAAATDAASSHVAEPAAHPNPPHDAASPGPTESQDKAKPKSPAAGGDENAEIFEFRD